LSGISPSTPLKNDLRDTFAEHGTVTEPALIMDRIDQSPPPLWLRDHEHRRGSAEGHGGPERARIWADAPSPSTLPSRARKNAPPAAGVIAAKYSGRRPVVGLLSDLDFLSGFG